MPHISDCDTGFNKIDMVGLAKKVCGFANITCPFCGCMDFDLSGLKSHLTHGDCSEYNEIKTLPRRFS